MGDRGNIYIKQHNSELVGESGIYLYSHWGGCAMNRTLQTALGHKKRWDDESYLTRLIFCEMIKDEDYGEDVGFGISTYPGDNEHPLLAVDCKKQTISMQKFPYVASETPMKIWTFEEYLKDDFSRDGEPFED